MPHLKNALLPALVMICAVNVSAEPLQTAPLSVVVDGLRNQTGAVIIAAFDEASAFQAMDIEKAVAFAQLPAAAEQVSVTFHDLPEGAYAFAALHDEDQDGDLDMKGGLPLEGYGFAAMGRRGMPPSFAKAAVATGTEATSKLHLKYWK